MIDGITEFGRFRELLAQLSNGQVNVIDCHEHGEIFVLTSGVSACLLASVAPSESGHVTLTSVERAYSIAWELSRDCWRQALAVIGGLTEASHQYFDYPQATHIVSFMEGLKCVAD